MFHRVYRVITVCGISTVTDLGLLKQAVEWQEQGYGVTLATVIDTWGSAPRKAGSWLVVREDGLFEGSVSGGCVEGAVIRDVLEGDSSQARLLTFGVSTEEAWSVGLSCGGELSIWIERATQSVLEYLICAIERRKTVGLQIDLSGVQPMCVLTDCSVLPDSKTLRQPTGETVRVCSPARRLFVVGAVHIAQALIPMAQRVGYVVTLIDPRSIFLDDARWGSVERNSDFPEEVFSDVNLGLYDAVVALSHNPTFDDEALWWALQSNAFYVGALGSRRNHAKRCTRLVERGCSPAQTDRICGPIGLNIGAQSPAEIAVAILAELIQYQRAPNI